MEFRDTSTIKGKSRCMEFAPAASRKPFWLLERTPDSEANVMIEETQAVH